VAAEDWIFGYDPYEWDGPPQPDECKWCKCEIYWIERKPYDDEDGDKPHNCPDRQASPSEFDDLEAA